MEKKEILKNNALIAEFIGLKQNEYGHYINENNLFDAQYKLFINELKFHSSWDWIMYVVEKIDELQMNNVVIDDEHFETCNFEFELKRNFATVHAYDYSKGQAYCDFVYNDSDMEENKKDAVYSAVVNFVKWFNKQMK